MKYYLGIDGGGTRTTAAVSDENGNILLKKAGKTINFYSVGMQKARENLDSLIAQICNELNISSFEAAFVGCSALDGEADAQTTQALCGGINAVKKAMNSDVYIALKSLECDSCPCIAICGTGSMAAGEDANGNMLIAGGWGHIIGDEGSGYSIAINALKKCCELCDEGRSTPLLEKANRFFGVDDFRKAIDIIYSPETTKDVLASFAAEVGAICESDEDAQDIITNEAHSFAKTVMILLNKIKGCRTLGMYGGIFAHNDLFLQIFTQDINSVYSDVKTVLLTTPPEEGALKLARKLK